MNMTQICEQLGDAATPELVSEYFGGKNIAEVLDELDELYPNDDNYDLAESIVVAIGQIFIRGAHGTRTNNMGVVLVTQNDSSAQVRCLASPHYKKTNSGGTKI